ncbi:MAG: hypothetical protein WD009_10455 [Phycisphaeraceae bacterium]
MKPIVLIHGYSAESEELTKPAINAIYGDLPQALRDKYAADAVVEVDLSRYISLDDGLTIDDVSRALDRALHSDHPHLLQGGFHAIVHSTGALVLRNWLRRFSPRPSPLCNLVYLAGANFGSGWAHIGKGQFAKWGSMIFRRGDRGVRILHALELGSDWTIDLHRHFLDPANSLPDKFEVLEHVVIGSQADAAWFAAPIRYAKEDGADGVVRVAASNLNFNYIRFEPTEAAMNVAWQAALDERTRDLAREHTREQWYRFGEVHEPGGGDAPTIPFAIPFKCAHSGDKVGIVTGSNCRKDVLDLIDLALGSTADNWTTRVALFDRHTVRTYDRAHTQKAPKWWSKWLTEPRAQYDKHAQVIVRVRDQDGRPVPNYDIFFDAASGTRSDALPIRELMETKHVNGLTPNIITFYLRTDAFDGKARGPGGRRGDWIPRVPAVRGCHFEVSATEPETGEILYLPLRYKFTAKQLTQFIQPHRTTILDVVLVRLPSPRVYRMVKL